MSVGDDYDDFGAKTDYKPSFVLIAIDTHPSMFVKRRDAETGEESVPFKDCLSVCYEIADSLIFTKNKRSWSPFGIVLGKSDDPSFVDFNVNVIDSIKFLKDKHNLTCDELVDQYQRKGDFSLSQFFLRCKKKFVEVSAQYYKRIVIYITNDDDPCLGDKTKRFTALNEVKTFNDVDIDFQMVTMNPNFDYSLFYNELFSLLKTPAVEQFIADADGLFEKLSSSVLVRFYTRRLTFFPVAGNNSKFLKVVQKNIIQKTKLYKNCYVSTEGQPVKKIGVDIGDVEPCYRLKHPEGILNFDIQENHHIKRNNLPVGYTLICVSTRCTSVGFALTKSPILEADPKEDLPYFDSFWQYCVDHGKVLVCVRKLRFQDKLRYVELIPKFANNTRLFVIKHIPFASEIKYPPTRLAKSVAEWTPNSEQVEVVNDLIAKLTFDYNPKMFANPSFVKKKAFLKSKFLGEPQEEVDDPTAKTDGIDARLGGIEERMKLLFDFAEWGAKKRKAPPKTSRAKKAK